jgi:hypothetical protein
VTFWSSPEETPRARKQHLCQLCFHPIEPGTVYRRWCCVIDDSKRTVKVHESCWTLLQEYDEPDPWEGYYEISDEALSEALRWHEPTREDCIRVAGEDGGRVWDLFLKPEDEEDAEEDAPRGGAAP